MPSCDGFYAPGRFMTGNLCSSKVCLRLVCLPQDRGKFEQAHAMFFKDCFDLWTFCLLSPSKSLILHTVGNFWSLARTSSLDSLTVCGLHFSRLLLACVRSWLLRDVRCCCHADCWEQVTHSRYQPLVKSSHSGFGQETAFLMSGTRLCKIVYLYHQPQIKGLRFLFLNMIHVPRRVPWTSD